MKTVRMVFFSLAGSAGSRLHRAAAFVTDRHATNPYRYSTHNRTASHLDGCSDPKTYTNK
jgi:hypothetical protein